jgi:NodT family efflux transporter outer membrane factor (OMF) lipoprotein
MKNVLLKQIGAVLVLAVGGCQVGPDYERPKLDVPDAWHTSLMAGLNDDAAELGAWWRTFDDPILSDLIACAEARNLTLATAASTVRAARAQYGIAAADLYPTISLDTSGKFTDGVDRTPTIDVNSTPPFISEGHVNQGYQLGLDLAWEVDLWGRVARSVEAAEADVQASMEHWRDVLVTVRAEVAQSYIAARSYQAQVIAVQASIDTQVTTLELTQQQFEVGTSSDLAVAQAQASLAAVQAKLPALVNSLATSMNGLSILIGEAPGALRDRLSIVEPIPQPSLSIGVGIPADTIRRRPDVRMAERALAAATADIGVAEASLLPSLAISGAGGYTSTDFSRWLDSANLGSSLGLQLNWPIFTAGRLKAMVNVADEQAVQALYQYELAVLGAIGDVENALIGYTQAVRQQRQVGHTVAAYERVVALARERYTVGADSLKTLLAAENSLATASQTLAEVDGLVSVNAVLLYKALGGAWQNIEEEQQIVASQEDQG